MTEIAEAYGILQSTLSTYLRNWDMIGKQATESVEISKMEQQI
jgi:hypothetical protein